MNCLVSAFFLYCHLLCSKKCIVRRHKIMSSGLNEKGYLVAAPGCLQLLLHIREPIKLIRRSKNYQEAIIRRP